MKVGLAAAGAALVAAAVVIPGIDAGAVTPHSWTLTAPGGTGPTATVSLSSTGKLTLGVRDGGATVLNTSALGIRTSAADLSTGLSFTSRSDTHVTGTYATPSGRRRQHSIDANQTTLTFSKGADRLDVIFSVEDVGL